MSTETPTKDEQYRQKKLEALQRLAKSNEQLAQYTENMYRLKLATSRSCRVNQKELCSMDVHDYVEEYSSLHNYHSFRCQHCHAVKSHTR